MNADSPKELNEVEIFVPAPRSDDAEERAEFLAAASDLIASGYPIRLYTVGEDDWAFEQCDPVREILDINGADALPITLLGPTIMGMYSFPDRAKIVRLSETPTSTPKQATNACVPTSGGAAPLTRKDSPIKGLFSAVPAALATPEPRGPEIGERWNLMGGDTGQGLPPVTGSTGE